MPDAILGSAGRKRGPGGERRWWKGMAMAGVCVCLYRPFSLQTFVEAVCFRTGSSSPNDCTRWRTRHRRDRHSSCVGAFRASSPSACLLSCVQGSPIRHLIHLISANIIAATY
jgi:hypothetical protein